MIEFRGGHTGRCDITELEENDEWENMPLGRTRPDEEEKNEDDGEDDEVER